MARSPQAAAGTTPGAESRRGRPSLSRAGAIDATIRTAALELFLEEGFDAVTMEMIARRAQVSKPTLYTRHAGKVELLRAVVQDEVGRWLSLAQSEEHQRPTDLAGRLRLHARYIIASQGWSDLGRLTRLVNGVAANHPDILRSLYEAGLRPVIGYLAEDLRNAAAEVGAADADWDFLAEMFLHAILGWYGSASILGEADEGRANAFSEKMVQLVLTAATAGPRR